MSIASPETYLDDLNPAQRDAVLTTEGPLLVVAGAGSGKTRVLTHRVAHLINACGVKPQEILAITFTNKAAGEMRERLEDMLGGVARAIWILTFHAACGRILRREAARLGYRSNFTIYDQADQIRLTKSVLEELERDPKRFVPRGIHAQISTAKNNLVSPEEYRARVSSFYDQTVADAYDLYQRRLFASNAVDFDDMLFLTVRLLENFPEAREKWSNAFRYVLVDEYQDTNHAQYRLLQLVAEKHKNLFVVGDPDQSIYAFRGADIRNIMEFEHDFPGTRVIPLEQNYRSTNTILRGSNAVIANNRERKPKELWSELGDGDPIHVLEVEDEHAEARFVAVEIARLVEEGFSGSEIAIFYRTNAQSRVLEDVLVRQAIQYQVIGGPRFYERAEIKDADRVPAGDRQSVRRRLADADREPAAARDRRHLDRPPPDATRTRTGSRSGRRPSSPRRREWGRRRCAAVQALRTLLQSLMAGALELTVPELVERVLERSGYLDALEAERTIEAQGRIENLQELVGVGPGVPGRRGRAEPLQLPPGDLALLRPGRDPRRAEPRHADDAPQREGARVPGRLHDRDGGGDLPALALARGGDARGGAAPGLRRDDAGEGAARRSRMRPRARSGARGTTTCRRASSTSCPTRASSASGCGPPPGRATGAADGRAADGRPRSLDGRQRQARDARRGRRHRDRRRAGSSASASPTASNGGSCSSTRRSSGSRR